MSGDLHVMVLIRRYNILPYILGFICGNYDVLIEIKVTVNVHTKVFFTIRDYKLIYNRTIFHLIYKTGVISTHVKYLAFTTIKKA